MSKLTLLLAFITCAIATLTGAVLWRLFQHDAAALQPSMQGSSIQIGIPEVRPAAGTELFAATSAVLWDSNEQRIKFEQNGFARVPIASLTKLMTAMVAIDHGIPWDAPATIELSEYSVGGTLLLHPGETVTMRDLFAASLLGSANNATRAYVRQLGFSPEKFVEEMNRKAVALGLEQTHFEEVTGLSPQNVSTAYEVARLAEYAFTNYPEITEMTQRTEYVFTVGGTGRAHAIRNSNKLISEQGVPLSGSKTGFLYESLYCLVIRGAGEYAGRVAVVLGSPAEPQNMTDTLRLLTLPLP